MRRAFKLTGVLLTLLMLTSFTKPNPPKKKLDTVSLLNESYALLAQIDDSSQVFYLLPLTQVGAKVISPREEEWCIRLFRQSSSVSDQWDRVALEKNALVELSAVNSDAAMELFWQVEEPASDARGRFPEDVRADAASHIFPNYWDAQVKVEEGANGLSERRLQAALTEIRRQAVHIGKTGEYPYRGIAQIIKRLEAQKNHESEIYQTFGEALKFYSEGVPKFRNRNAEFLILLQTAKSAVPDVNLLRSAINAFLENVTASASKDDVDYQGYYTTPQGVVKFTDRKRALIFRAIPAIREIDPHLAKSLIEEDKDLDKATEGMTYSGGVIEENVTPQEAAKMHSRMQQISLLAEIQLKQQTVPQEAKRLAEALPDAQMRLLGLSSTVPGMMRIDPAAARAIYDDQRTQLQEFTEDEEKSQVLVALTKAAYYVNDEDDFKVMTGRTFEHAVELYKRDYRQRPDLRPDLRMGYAELREIVRFAASHNLKWIIDRIRLVQNVELKAHLLIYAADGLSEFKPVPVTVATNK